MSATRACVLVLALLGALVAAACASRLRAQQDAQDERGRIPTLPMLPPLSADAWTPAQGAVRLVVRDVSFTTSLGARVRIPFTEVRAPAPPDFEHVRLESVRVVGLSVISPADSIDTPFDPFLRVPGPRVSIRRFTLEDAVLGARAHPSQYEGEWLWRQEDVDVVLERIGFGGDEPIGAIIARADFAGEVRGRPLRLERLTGGLTRTLSRLETDLRASLGTTGLDLAATIHRDGRYAVQIATDTLLFREVRALLRAAPEVGSAAGVVRIGGTSDGARIEIPVVRAYAGESWLVARGGIRTGSEPGADSLIIEIPRLRAEDLEAVAGASMPGGGEWAGEMRAADEAGGGLRVTGALHRQDASGRLVLDGIYRADGAPQVAATLRASELRVAEGELRAQIEARGPRDSLRVTGDLELRSEWSGTNGSSVDGRTATALDASLEGVVHGRGESRIEATLAVRGLVRGEAVTADARGRVGLTGERPVAVSFETGALPASLLLPAAFDSVGGTVAGSGTIGGTLDEPLLDARALLSRVEPNAGDSVSVVADGEVRVRGALGRPRADADIALRSSRGGDRLGWIEGRAVLARDGELDVRIVADSLPLTIVPDGGALRDVRGFGTGTFLAGGTVDAPEWSGGVEVREGGFVVVRSGTPVDSLTGELRLDGESARVRLDGTAGPGPVWLEGEIRFARAPRTLVLAFRADSALLVATDSARVIASAEVWAEGEVTRPHVSGTIALRDGWIHEDNFKRRPPLDPGSLPYEELRRRVPWFEERPEEPPLAVEAPPEEESQVPPPPESAGEAPGPPFTGGVRVEIMPGVRIIDEDSEMYGRGTIDVTADSSGVRADGIYRIHGGFYANFGERFHVVGGAFVFQADGVEPRMTLRAEHDTDVPLVSGIEGGLHVFDWQPPLELFAIGTPSVVSEELRRTALLPESQTELASYLLTQTETQPVGGWRARPFWPSGNGGEVAGARAGSQSLPLLWAYIADEGYDYLPLRVGYLRAGTVSISGEYPAPIPVSSLLRAAATAGRWEALLSQPSAGWPAPGLRVRYGTGGLSVFAFDEPRYRPVAVPGGGVRPWDLRRRSGIGLRWRRDFD